MANNATPTRTTPSWSHHGINSTKQVWPIFQKLKQLCDNLDPQDRDNLECLAEFVLEHGFLPNPAHDAAWAGDRLEKAEKAAAKKQKAITDGTKDRR
jgi:hypothetical protein